MQATGSIQPGTLVDSNMTPGGLDSMQFDVIVKENNGLQVAATTAKCMPSQEPGQAL
jgi:hypothetical protein